MAIDLTGFSLVPGGTERNGLETDLFRLLACLALHPLCQCSSPPALQVAARRCRGADCWYRCRACQSIKAARSAALAAHIKSDLKQPNRKSSGARLPRLRQSALDGKKVMGARQFQSPLGAYQARQPKRKGLHSKERACVVTRACRVDRRVER
jgi:hypothetical protein